MSVTTRPTYVPQPNVVFAQVGDESILLNTETGLYFGLDSVGTRIWMRLTEGATHDQICSDLLAEYDIDSHTLRADIERLVDTLSARGLIVSAVVTSF